MNQPRPDIDPRPIPEIVPQPEPAQPQPVDPVPPQPQEVPTPPQPVEDPVPGQPELPPGPGNEPTPQQASMTGDHKDKAEEAPPPEPVPPMPVHLPTSDAEAPHTSPLRYDDEPIDPRLPPEPGNDINP